MPRDPLSRTLELIDVRTIYAGGFIGGGDWSIRFDPPRKIKFYVIGRGSCLLKLEGIPEPFELKAGDIFLMTRNSGFTLASNLSIPSQHAHDVFKGAGGSIVPVGEGDDFFFLGGHLDTNHAGGRLIMESLPDYLHIPASSSGAGRLESLIRELVEEAASHAPGAAMACSSLAHLVLIQILRRHLAGGTHVVPGWLNAACDPRLAPALTLMHGDIAREWTLVELAQAAAMSRTAFATHFKTVAGMPPLAYLTEWRMQQADRALRQEGNSVASVARSVGYRSEASFGTAFKRVMGRSPRRPVTEPLAEEA